MAAPAIGAALRRATDRLGRTVYDVVIVGGGIYGCWAAWDAALRGLRVALVERDDFGAATSASSQRIIHGGLRHLQHGDLGQARESARECRVLRRVAPRLVRPLPVVLPLAADGPSRTAIGLALGLHDLLAFDRNRDVPAGATLPRGRLLSAAEVRQRCPWLAAAAPRGGLVFHDAQVRHAGRLIVALLAAAAAAGADLANHVEVTGFLRQGRRVGGVRCRDRATGQTLDVRAAMVLSCAGPWTEPLLQRLGPDHPAPRLRLGKAVVLVLPAFRGHEGVGVPRRTDRGYLFVTPGQSPWRATSLVGTFHGPWPGQPDEFRVGAAEIRGYLDEFNAACPGTGLGPADVAFVHGGLVPAEDGAAGWPARRPLVLDHEREDGPAGLVSVVGVKYTTARAVAGRAVDLVVRRLGRGRRRGLTAVTPLDRGAPAGEAGEPGAAPGPGAEAGRRLRDLYGPAHPELLRLCREDPAAARPVSEHWPLLGAEVLHAVRAEMARTLGDVLFRRTELAAAGYPGDATLEACAALMARELGWDRTTERRQVEAVAAAFAAPGRPA